MGLLDGLEKMTPAQQGLLGMGLGMMGQRGSFSEAMGRGGLNGMAMMQQAQALKRKQALEDLQMEKYQYDLDKGRAQDVREDAFRSSLPNINATDNAALSKALFDAGLYEDAIKLKTKGGLFGGSGDYQFIAGPNGKLMVGNKDTGTINWGKIGDQEAVIATYDPTTKANIKSAEEGEKYADIPRSDGSTVRAKNKSLSDLNDELALLAGEGQAQYNQFRQSQGMPPAKIDLTQTVTGQPAYGVSQSTANKKKSEELGKAQAEIEKTKIDAVQMAEKQTPLLNDAEVLLSQATNGFIDNAGNVVNRAFGRSTAATKADAQLHIIGKTLTSYVPRAPGAQSNVELEYAAQQAGNIGDPNVPIGDRMAALQYMKKRNQLIAKGYANAADVLYNQHISKSQAKPQQSIDDIVNLYNGK